MFPCSKGHSSVRAYLDTIEKTLILTKLCQRIQNPFVEDINQILKWNHNFQLIILNNCPTIFFITFLTIWHVLPVNGAINRKCPLFCVATKEHAIPKIVKFMTSSFPIFFYQSRKENTLAKAKFYVTKMWRQVIPEKEKLYMKLLGICLLNKGQIKRTFGTLSKKPNKQIRFYYYDKFVRSFFVRIQGHQKVLSKSSDL